MYFFPGYVARKKQISKTFFGFLSGWMTSSDRFMRKSGQAEFYEGLETFHNILRSKQQL